MAIQPLDLARGALVEIYDPAFMGWDSVFNIGGVYGGVRRIGNDDLITFRGSVTPDDWLNDFDVFGYDGLAHDLILGDLHAGMWRGVLYAYSQVSPKLGDSVYVSGHSLGAAHAGAFAGLLVKDGKIPKTGMVFGEPKIGMQKLADLLSPVPWVSYCNRHSASWRFPVYDPVTQVPFTIPPLFEFRHPRPMTYLDVEPDNELPTSLHHSTLYWSAVQKFL